MSDAKIEILQKHVGVVYDEVKVKEGLVYDKHECRIIGCIDLGKINDTLMAFEKSIDTDESPVAKQMLFYVIRGLFIQLNFPLAQYHTCGVTADSLFSWIGKWFDT